MKMMSKNGTDTAKEVKETFTIFNASGRCAAQRSASAVPARSPPPACLLTPAHPAPPRRHSGSISKDELKMMMDRLGEKYDPKDLDEMISTIDTSGSGQVRVWWQRRRRGKGPDGQRDQGAMRQRKTARQHVGPDLFPSHPPPTPHATTPGVLQGL